MTSGSQMQGMNLFVKLYIPRDYLSRWTPPGPTQDWTGPVCSTGAGEGGRCVAQYRIQEMKFLDERAERLSFLWPEQDESGGAKHATSVRRRQRSHPERGLTTKACQSGLINRHAVSNTNKTPSNNRVCSTSD